uniref:P-loop containing nucleoside triphosphate hydrolase protein n=1 Tax=Kwoniella bestiolae CBS 10118 TaxID=1296100 RepID=A0A1B9G2R7_9TREE|nr:hypothetical protein I302_05139 [Kwoniella bestiolae CBS 10118]OCF25323.1 hypothetical protein I302_05139 [Kwoniella bestiolae CBS 10118]
MSVAQPGDTGAMNTDKYLSGIEVGTAAELTSLLCHSAFPVGPTFLESLDELILEGRGHPGGSTLMRGDLIELVGSSGSGKTTFLTNLIFTTILPTSLPDLLSTPLDGRGLHVTLIQPVTHRSIIPHLKRAIRQHIKDISPTTPVAMVDRVIDESLSRLTVYRPKPRWKDYALCLKRVLDNATEAPRGIPNDSSSSRDGKREGEGLDLLVIDGMGDPHYPTRWAEEQKGYKYYDGMYKDKARILGMEEIGVKQVMECVGRVRKMLGGVVVMSTQGLRPHKDSSSLFHTHLPPPYPSSSSSSPNMVNLNTKLSDLNPTYWPVNIQITFTGLLRNLQYPMESTLVETLQSKYRRQRDRAEQTKVYEGTVKMGQTSQGSVSTIAGGRFRFGIDSEGLLVQI